MMHNTLLTENDLCQIMLAETKPEDNSVNVVQCNMLDISKQHIVAFLDHREALNYRINARLMQAIGLNPVETDVIKISAETYSLCCQKYPQDIDIKSGDPAVLVMKRANGIELSEAEKTFGKAESQKIFEKVSPDLLARTALAGLFDTHAGNIFVKDFQTEIIDFEGGPATVKESTACNMSWILNNFTGRMMYPHFQVKLDKDQLISIADEAEKHFTHITSQPENSDLGVYKNIICQNHQSFVEKMKYGWKTYIIY